MKLVLYAQGHKRTAMNEPALCFASDFIMPTTKLPTIVTSPPGGRYSFHYLIHFSFASNIYALSSTSDTRVPCRFSSHHSCRRVSQWTSARYTTAGDRITLRTFHFLLACTNLVTRGVFVFMILISLRLICRALVKL